jgi:hypothetical protein
LSVDGHVSIILGCSVVSPGARARAR